MHLEVHPGNLSDFTDAESLYGPTTGDLVAPLADTCWPLDKSADLEAHRKRAVWSMQSQRNRAASNPSIRVVKVIDTDAPAGPKQLVGLGRWMFMEEKEESLPSGAGKSGTPSATPELPPELNKDLFFAYMRTITEQSSDLEPSGSYWRLETIVTRKPYRRQGAGTMMLKWGMEQAKKAGLPAVLESGPTNKGWYESHGFREIGREEVEVLGKKDVIAHMRVDP